MEELKNAFVKNYSRLYQTDDDHESGEFYDAVDKFDEMSANDSQFAATVQKFNKYMGDLISSDREAAAFVMALDDLEKAKTPRNGSHRAAALLCITRNGDPSRAAPLKAAPPHFPPAPRRGIVTKHEKRKQEA